MRSRWKIWFILLLTIATILIDLPKIPLKFSLGGWSIDTTIGGYSVDFYVFNRWWTRDLSFRQGLDLQGGAHVVFEADMVKVVAEDRAHALEAAKNVIDKRINFFGVTEPVIQTAVVGNQYRVLVDLPGVVNVDEAIALVGRTAQLEFRELNDATTSATPSAVATPSALDALLGQSPQYVSISNTLPTGLTGAELKRADPGFDSKTGKPVVNLEFTSDGAKTFADVTRRNVNKPLAMFLDGEALMNPAPIIQPSLAGDPSGRAVISGSLTATETKALSVQLRAGALPVPMHVVEQRQIGPTLGAETVRKSVIAGAIGFLIVMLFMVFSYGRMGLLADLALCLYSLTVLALFKLWPVTLTLAGVAGFILSIGMAVDANILIFERIREERRWGQPLGRAVALGFERAWFSIRDSNVSSLITTFLLFQFGTGLIRGFAITLAIGILVSMFTAIVVTRTFVRIFIRI